ncbi:b18351d8-56c1-456c-b318-ffdd50c99cf2 [Thermothielavioides terrestris]|uniref:B18351d8-56c1-456c-b318-ffdd50c99cf2 n=1 Tax=Thermothielavioides terrestris TaxID=2587410 RepID=A0A3S4F4C5_9PEZI|nr:b18351d8-56c1-456c-b318-ffdd50c99cf2 [Thermothielavioides terrestris]
MYQIGNVNYIATIAVIGGALFGFDISSMSAMITTQPYLCQFNERGFDDSGRCLGPSDSTQGGITAAMPGGSLFGALASGFLSDRFGRKATIQLGSLFWIIGSALMSGAANIAMLVVSRAINGFAIGICSAQVPVYISEIAPPDKRGRLVSGQQWAITWGIMIMYFICYGCAFIDNSAAFRLPWALQMIPALLLLGGVFLLPESPRWLIKKKRLAEATEVLALVRAKSNRNSPLVKAEFDEIVRTVQEEHDGGDARWREVFAPKMLNRTSIGVFTQIWSQLSGMNVMMYYITYVFTMAGLSASGSDNGEVLKSSSIQFVINVVMTIPALLWMDRWGRRPTLLVGAALMCLWLSINAGLFAVYSHPPSPGEFTSTAESMEISGAPAKAVVASTLLFVATFAPTWGPVSWTVYVLFAVFCAAMFLHVFFMFPETANKTLEEIQDIFDDTKPGAIKYLGTPAWKTRNDRSKAVRSGPATASQDMELQSQAPSNEVTEGHVPSGADGSKPQYVARTSEAQPDDGA